MAILYQGYRGEHYFQSRNKVEPWYTRKVNICNLSADIIDSRRQGLIAFLEKWLEKRGARNSMIADIGGDAGQLIPLEAASEAYVVEASDQPPVAGVRRVANLEEIREPVTLLMCCHVLEHLSLPADFLSSLAKSCSLAPDCLVYLEVPLEHWKILPGMNNWLYGAYLSCLQRIRPLLIIIDFISTAMRGYAGLAMPPAFMKLHEHINYFIPKSLFSLAEVAGLNVLEVKVETGSFLATHQGVIRMACRTSAAL